MQVSPSDELHSGLISPVDFVLNQVSISPLPLNASENVTHTGNVITILSFASFPCREAEV